VNINLPIVLTIGGHDPTGGAGIIKDIEAIKSNNCHAVSLVSCLTCQNTYQFKNIAPVDSFLFSEQAEVLLSGVEINTIKIGAISSLDLVEIVEKSILDQLENVKVILDPVINSSTHGTLADQATIDGLKSIIFPKSFLITPNLEEAKILSGKRDLNSALEVLFSFSPKYILVKDIEDSKEKIVNQLYSPEGLVRSWSNKRLKGNFHGTGCYLASSIASLIANSETIETSIQLAQLNTLKAIKNSIKIGKGQRILRGQ
jgi:hydroxymethylpyrimidine/phosphomethylpyrimidine kinase